MNRDDLDRYLTDDEIVPSSGFVANVMDAVRAEAAGPPPIPFPWARALPGMVAVVVALVATIAGFFIPCGSTEVATQPLSNGFSTDGPLTWALAMLLLSGIPVVFSLRMMRGPS